MKNTDGVKNNSGKKQDVIFIIERASFQLVPVGKCRYDPFPPKNTKFELFNGSKHRGRYGADNSVYQPEIAHEAIKAVLGSPLNKSGQLKALYVKTENDVLIEIKPHARIPEDYDSFAELMLQLLQRSCIAGAGTREKVLRIVQNPVTRYLPANSVKIALSHCHGYDSYEKRVDIQRNIAKISSEKPLVFVVGAMAYGTIDVDYVDEYIMIDKHPESATICIKKICDAVHKK